MKKVLHYVGIMNRGGMETLIMNLYRNIDLNRFQFDFAAHSYRTGDFDEEITQMGGKIFHFPAYRSNPGKYRNEWRKFFTEHSGEYAAFHFHTNSLANLVALEEAARSGVPVRIVHSHSSFANKGRLQYLNNFLHRFHQKKLKHLATHLLACSTEAANWLYGGNCLDGKNVILMHNGINCDNYTYNAEQAERKKKELGIGDKTVVGHIGKFIKVKNHQFLLSILSQMIEQNKDIVALLIGDGELAEQMKSLAEQLSISENVYFLGVRSDIPELLMCMDLFLMPSLYEGLPVSMIEAQASGVPALISDTISKEVKIKDNVYFQSLQSGSDVWAESAQKILREKRIIDNSSLKAAGYDIKDSVLQYIKIIDR